MYKASSNDWLNVKHFDSNTTMSFKAVKTNCLKSTTKYGEKLAI